MSDDQDDGGLQWYAQQGAQEQEEWLNDPEAQREYQEYLKSLERKRDEMGR